MPTPGIRLGVDFGTSNTVAVVRWPDGRSRALLFDGSPLLPSAVYAEPGGTVIVGRDAVHSARLEPARFEPNPKRRIDEGTVLLGDREIPVNDLVASVLRRVRDEWTRTVGDVASEVTVTFPASWGATRRLAVADAAAAAGLGRVRLVPEPVAAAAYFTQVLGREVPVGSVVVVHDFGAGTFDASVVARTRDGFEVLAVDGRDDIGGIDVDNAIVAHIGSICQPQAPEAWQRLISPQTVEDRRARRLLWDDARVAKERLSRQPASDLTVPLLNIDVHLTREELEKLAQPLLEQTVRVTQGVMRWAQLSEGSVAGVFLVGGSSRMPLVGTLLHRALGTAPVVIEQPELVVAEGSMLTGSTAIPVTAAPAPGPATGVIPQVPGFEWQDPGADAPLWPQGGPGANQPAVTPPGGYVGPSSGEYVGPSSAPPANYAAPQSAPPAGYGAPQSAPPANYGAPQSAPQANYAAPQSAPPANFSTPQSAPPVDYGPAGYHAPQSAPPANYGPAGYNAPQSAPPANYGAPQSAPPANYAAPQSAPPANYGPAGYNAPQSAPPANYGAPQSAPANYGQPVSAPPNRSGGRVFVSGGGVPVSPAAPPEPATRYDEYGSPIRQHSPQFGHAPQPPRPPGRVQQPRPQARPRRGFFARAMLTLLTVFLLAATPVVAGYVAFYLTAHHWPPPADAWFNPSGGGK